MLLSEHAYQRILMHYFAGHKAPLIQKLLVAEGVFCFAHSHLKVLVELQVERNNRKARSKWEKKFANMPDTSHCEITNAER